MLTDDDALDKVISKGPLRASRGPYAWSVLYRGGATLASHLTEAEARAIVAAMSREASRCR